MKHGTVIAMAVQQMTCTGCGAEANASCNCGKPYVPKKQRVADYDKENPGQSTRQAAVDLGVSKSTVSDARQGVQDRTPEIEGRDGKVYRLPTRAVEPDDDDIEAEIEPANYRGAFLIRADQAKRFASYSGPITPEIVAMSRQVATVWGNLAAQLEKSL